MATKINRLEREVALLRRPQETCNCEKAAKPGVADVLRGAAPSLVELEKEAAGLSGAVAGRSDVSSGHSSEESYIGHKGVDYDAMMAMRAQVMDQVAAYNITNVLRHVREGVAYCHWGGVKCSQDGTGRVLRLRLRRLAFIPPAVARLDGLTQLYFMGSKRAELLAEGAGDVDKAMEFYERWHTMKHLHTVYLRLGLLRVMPRFPPRLRKLVMQNKAQLTGSADWSTATSLVHVRRTRFTFEDDFFTGIEKAPALRELNFVGRRLPDLLPKTLRVLSVVLKQTKEAFRPKWAHWCGSLRSLHLSGSVPLETIFQGIQECQQLQSFGLSDASNVGPRWDGQVPWDVLSLGGLREFTWSHVNGTMDSGMQIPNTSKMERISLAGLGLRSVPPQFTDAKMVEKLDLSNNRLDRIPWMLQNMTYLKRLFMRDNAILERPTGGFMKMLNEVVKRSLEEARLGMTEGEVFEAWFGGNPFFDTMLSSEFRGHHVALEVIHEMVEMGVRSDRLARARDDLCNGALFVCNGKIIDGIRLSGLGLTALPPSLGNFTNSYMWIELDKNRLSSIPRGFFKRLKMVERLSLDHNYFSTFPEELLHISIKDLSFSHNAGLNQLPENFDRSTLCQSLKQLYIENNGIVELPNSLSHCPSLKLLSASFNRIEKIPLKWPESLNDLMLIGNRLTAESLDGLSMAGANVLRFRANRIERWPDLRNVRGRLAAVFSSIDMSYNQIQTIDPNIFGLGGKNISFAIIVNYLDLSHNRIEHLPEELFATSLFSDFLYLDFNKIREIPRTLYLSKHKVIDLANNDLTSLPVPSFYRAGMSADAVSNEVNRRLAEINADGLLGGVYFEHGEASKAGVDYGKESMSMQSRGLESIRLDYNQLGEVSDVAMKAFLASFEHRMVVSTIGNPRLRIPAIPLPPQSRWYMDTEMLPFMNPIVSDSDDDETRELIRRFDFSSEDISALIASRGLYEKLRFIADGHVNSTITVQSFNTLVNDAKRDSWTMREGSRRPQGNDVFKECMVFTITCNGRELMLTRCLCLDRFYEGASDPYKCRQCPRMGECSEGLLQCYDSTYRTVLSAQELSAAAVSTTPDVECQPCPEGGICDGSETVIPTAGHWKKNMDDQVFVSCPNDKACLGGEESECAEGYTGVLCGMCEHGYYSSGAHECSRCPAPFISILVFVLGVGSLAGASVIVFMIAASMLNREKAIRKARLTSSTSMVSQSMTSMRSLAGSANTMKISVSFLQIATSLNITFDVEWPDLLGLLEKLFGWVNFDVMRSTSFECMWELFTYEGQGSAEEAVSSSGFGYAERMVIGVMILVGAMALLWGGYALVRLLKYGMTCGVQTPELWRAVMQVQVVLWQLAYLPLSYMAVQYFHCRTFDNGDTFYIANDLATTCYDHKYWSYGVLAMLTIALFTFGLPALVLVIGLRRSGVLRREPRAVVDPTAPDYSLGAILCQGYHPRYQWWEALEMLRRVTVGGLVVLLSGSSTFQLTVAMAAMFLFTVMHFRCWPNISREANVTQAVFLILTYFTMALGILRTLEVPSGQRAMFTGIVVGTDVVVLVALMGLVTFDVSKVAWGKVLGMHKLFRRRLANK